MMKKCETFVEHGCLFKFFKVRRVFLPVEKYWVAVSLVDSFMYVIRVPVEVRLDVYMEGMRVLC